MSFDPTAAFDTAALQASASKHMWPHFTNRKVLNDGIPVISRAEGHHIYDAQGKQYIEGMAGLWSVAVGFNEPRLAQAAYEQMPPSHRGTPCGGR